MENFWQILFVDLRLVLIFAVPLLTMRLLAEERRLAAMAVAAGWTLLEVQVKPPTLEDLFVRLVGSEP